MNEKIEKQIIEFEKQADSYFQGRPWLEVNFNFFSNFFKKENLEKAEWEDFQEMGNHLHAFNSLPIAKKNALGRPNLSIEDYRKNFAYIKFGDDEIDIKINNLLKKYKGNYPLPFFADSSISELVAYALPDQYVLYNRRSINALKTLGVDIAEVKSEKFGQLFKRYNVAILPIIQKYAEIVGQRTKTSLHIEIDQFFSWLYDKQKPADINLKNIIDEFKEYLSHDDTILNKFTFSNVNETFNYVWVSDHLKIIKDSIAHYEITKRHKKLYVEIHFEGTKEEADKFNLNIKELPSKAIWFPWRNSQSISYSEPIDPFSENLMEQLKDALLYLEENIGDKIREIKGNKNNVNYWVFQGNTTKGYRIFDALENNVLNTWMVNQHSKEIAIGDKVILRVGGEKPGIYAMATIISNVSSFIDVSPDADYYSNPDENILQERVHLKLDYNLIHNPILKEKMIELGIPGGTPGTNFPTTKAQYLAVLKLIENKSSKKYWLYAPGENAEMWDEYYDNNIMGIGWDSAGDLNNYKTKADIELKLQELEKTDGSKKNDASALFDFKEGISKGDIIIVKKGRGELLGYGEVTSDYYYEKTRPRHQKLRSVKWIKKGNWKTDHSLALKTLTDITKYPTEDSSGIENFSVFVSLNINIKYLIYH